MVGYILPEVLCRVLACKRVGVVAVGQQQHPDVHALCKQHVSASQCGMDAGLVAVVDKHDVLRKPVEHTYLVERESRARIGNHVFQAALVHRYDVSVSLHHVDAVLLGYLFLCLIDAVELLFLVVYLRVGRVHVFLLHALGGLVELASAEGHHLAAHAYPGEYHASGKAVGKGWVPLDTVAQARLQQKLSLVALILCRSGQGIALWQAVAQSEAAHDVVAYAAAAEVLHTVGHAVGSVPQRVLEVSGSPFVHYIHRLALALGLLFFRGQLSLVYLDVILGSQPPQGFGIGHLLMFHDEAHGCAALAAREALADVARWRHIERGRSVVVERTQSLVVHSALA